VRSIPPGEPIAVPSPAGDLEGFLDRPPGRTEPAALAVICHPHPLHGGSAANKVVVSVSREWAALGILSLRFNFRGVGASPGAFDGGRGEGEDAVAAVTAVLRAGGGARRVLLAGYSFGAWVALRSGVADARVEALLGIGIPLTILDFGFLARAKKPVLVIQGERDEFGPASEVAHFAKRFAPAVRVEEVPGLGHFFDGALAPLRAAAGRFLAGLDPPLLDRRGDGK